MYCVTILKMKRTEKALFTGLQKTHRTELGETQHTEVFWSKAIQFLKFNTFDLASRLILYYTLKTDSEKGREQALFIQSVGKEFNEFKVRIHVCTCTNRVNFHPNLSEKKELLSTKVPESLSGYKKYSHNYLILSNKGLSEKSPAPETSSINESSRCLYRRTRTHWLTWTRNISLLYMMDGIINETFKITFIGSGQAAQLVRVWSR